jgi:hypothetical protein
MEDSKIFAKFDAESIAMLQSLFNAPTSASVKFMITRREEKTLLDLGYSQECINKLTPQEAADIILASTRSM